MHVEHAAVFCHIPMVPCGNIDLYHVASPQTASFIEIMADGQPKKSIEIIVLVDYSAFNAMIMIVPTSSQNNSVQ